MKLDFVNAYGPKVSLNGSNVSIASFIENPWPDEVTRRARYLKGLNEEQYR